MSAKYTTLDEEKVNQAIQVDQKYGNYKKRFPITLLRELLLLLKHLELETAG